MAILSIQSHVAYGHVGNAAAVFPLQRLGREVWPIHTVLFSNHPGYGGFAGPILPADAVRDQVDGLSNLGVLRRCSAVLSGYLGDVALGAAVSDAVAKVRAANPSAIYVCDPVMGDDGPGLYVQDEIPDFMRQHLIPEADVVIPNRFELGILTDRGIGTLPDAIEAARSLITTGPRLVLITSLERPETPPDIIEMLAVTNAEAWLVATPCLDFPVAPNGSGDATAALFTAFYLEEPRIGNALSRTASAIFAVMEATHAANSRELALISVQDHLASPDRQFTAARVA